MVTQCPMRRARDQDQDVRHGFASEKDVGPQRDRSGKASSPKLTLTDYRKIVLLDSRRFCGNPNIPDVMLDAMQELLSQHEMNIGVLFNNV